MSQYVIKDGTGTGSVGKVDVENRLWTFAVSEQEELHVNRHDKDAYVVYTDITPTGAGDTFFYLKNTDTRDLIVKWYRVWTESSAEAIDLYRNHTGATVGGTTITPVNMNFGSNKSAIGTFEEGVDITGLSGGVLIDRLRISGDGKDVVDQYPGGMVISQGSVLTAQVLNGAIPVEFTISFFYSDLGDV